jgi:hypothetical protein
MPPGSFAPDQRLVSNAAMPMHRAAGHIGTGEDGPINAGKPMYDSARATDSRGKVNPERESTVAACAQASTEQPLAAAVRRQPL